MIEDEKNEAFLSAFDPSDSHKTSYDNTKAVIENAVAGLVVEYYCQSEENTSESETVVDQYYYHLVKNHIAAKDEEMSMEAYLREGTLCETDSSLASARLEAN